MTGYVKAKFSWSIHQRGYSHIYRLQNAFNALLLSIALFFLPVQSLFAQPTVKWDKSFGNSGISGVNKVRRTFDGNFIAAGNASFESSEDKVQVGKGRDAWIIKYDSDGKIVWERTIIDNDSGFAIDVIPSSDGGYAVVCESSSSKGWNKSENSRGGLDYWIIKLDANGIIQWDRTLGGNDYDHASSIIETLDGGFLVGGASSSGISGEKTSASKGELDYWIVKLSSTGKKQWDRTIGGTGLDEFSCLQQTRDGGYLVGGSSWSTVGADKSEARAGADYWIVKIDSVGNKLWDKTFGGNAYDRLGLIYPHPDGGYVLSGTSFSSPSFDRTEASRGEADVWLVKINSNGEKEWDKAFGGSGWDQFGNLEQTADGGYLLATTSDSEKGGEKSEDRKPYADLEDIQDFWLIKVSSTFDKVWDKTIGGSRGDYLKYATELSSGKYLLAGSSNSGNPADPNYDRTAMRKGANDIWLVGAQESTPPIATPIIRINAGGPAFTTVTKKLFIADQYYSGIDRTSSIATGDILNTTNDVLYRSGRCSPSFSYNIPVANGKVEVILHFAETYFGSPGKKGGAGSRQFHVTMEGSRKLTNFDIFAAAGGAMRAFQKSIPVTVTDGMLNIDFLTGAADLPRISAIEVIITSYTLKPLADVYIRDGNYSGTNFGIAPILDVKNNAIDASARRSSYLRFQLPASAAVTSAKLRIYGHNHENTNSISVHAYGVDNDTWTESGIVKTNAPAASTPSLGYAAVNNAYKYYEIDVTSYVKAQQQSGETLVSLLLADPNNRNIRLVFNSKEEGSNPPQLIVQTLPIVNSNTRLTNEEISVATEAEPESSSVYPNPVEKQFTVQVSSKHSEDITLDLLNSYGQSYQIVAAQKAIAGQKAEVDISGLSLSSGIYLLKIKSEAATEVIKVLVTD